MTWLSDRRLGVFQYTPEFAASGFQVAPLMMPLRTDSHEFPSLSTDTFKGLPGMLADSLPDRFGNRLIDVWLAGQERDPGSFTPVERLCYTGMRGMGALEFKPTLNEEPGSARKVEIDALVALANRVLDDRVALHGKFTGEDDRQAIEDILRVGTSAGGARAKAVLAWNSKTGEFRTGQVPAPKGFSQWLIKFDGVHGNKDKEIADPQCFGRIEYAYRLMARAAGIEMEDCRLHDEAGRAHFMTKRFDRSPDGRKLHMQSFGGMMHYDFNAAGSYAYEQVLQAIKRLKLPMHDIDQQVRRAIFNVIARNQDDHVKNIAFLMDKTGGWRLSPAFDVAYSYNPIGDWTSQHQMRLAGKRDRFELDDLITLAAVGGIRKNKTKSIVKDVSQAVADWRGHAKEAGVQGKDINRIENAHRRELFV